MTRKSRLGLISLSVIVALGGLTLLSRQPAQADSKQASASSRASLTVETVRPGSASWPMSLSANGAVAAWQEASISAETGGLRITALHADVGSVVKRGQLLAELASDTVRAELRQAEATVASARASLREAQANAKRGRVVKASGALSGQQIEQYEIAEQSADATLASAEAALASARVKLAQTRIVAVDSGIIATRSATLGTVVSSGTELFTMVRQQRVEWRAEVDARQLGQLKPGMTARVTLPGGQQLAGKLRQLSPTLSSTTRAATAYVDLPAGSAARAGMYVQGSIALGQQNALTLPSSAITLRDGHSYVFEVDAANKVIQRQVVTGRSQDDLVEVKSGLKPDVRVVLRGGAFLNDGDSVRISSSKEAA